MKKYSKESNRKFLENILNKRFKDIKNIEAIQDDYDKFQITEYCDSSLKDKLIEKYENLDCKRKDFIERFGKLNFKQAFIKNYFEGEQPRCCFCGQVLETHVMGDKSDDEYKKNNGKYPAYEYIVADIEHIFPKSKFPQFALHPKNWAPCCKECNEVIKGDKFFSEEPFEKFKIAIEDLKLDIKNLHPLKLWKTLKISSDINGEMNIIINDSLKQETKEFLNFYSIEKRAKIIFNRCYDILFSIIRHSDIRSPESLESLLENMASSNWHEINDGYSLNNSPQIWQEFIENILYDDCKLMALWDEVKSSYYLI